MDEIVDQLKSQNIIVNDRIGSKEKFGDMNFLGKSDYRVYEDRSIPKEKPSVPWQHINTIGLSWGYNKMQEKKDYKSGKQLLELYNKVYGLDGDFLINFGPTAQGLLDENEVTSMLDFKLEKCVEEMEKSYIIEDGDIRELAKNYLNEEVLPTFKDLYQTK